VRATGDKGGSEKNTQQKKKKKTKKKKKKKKKEKDPIEAGGRMREGGGKWLPILKKVPRGGKSELPIKEAFG